MSSSSEARVLRGAAAGAVVPLHTRDLRSGAWTRFGDADAVGDPVTEHTLDALATQTRAAATAQGYAVGWAEGRQLAAAEAEAEAADRAARAEAAETHRAAEHATAVAALRAAADRLQDRIAEVATMVETQGTDLALTLVRELLGHELRVATSADVVRRVLRVLPDDPTVVVRLSPGIVEDVVVRDLAERGVAVVADPSLSAEDALVETDRHVVDLRLDEAMARVASVLQTPADARASLRERASR